MSETSRGRASPGPRPLKGWRSRKVQGSRKMVFQKMARVPRIGGGRDTMTKGQTLTQDRTQNLERESARTGTNRTLLHGRWHRRRSSHHRKHSNSSQESPLNLLSVHPGELRTRPHRPVCTAYRHPQPLLMTATRPTQPSDHTCPSTRECPSTKKRGEALTFITTWRDPENTMLTESSRHRRTHSV